MTIKEFNKLKDYFQPKQVDDDKVYYIKTEDIQPYPETSGEWKKIVILPYGYDVYILNDDAGFTGTELHIYNPNNPNCKLGNRCTFVNLKSSNSATPILHGGVVLSTNPVISIYTYRKAESYCLGNNENGETVWAIEF